MSAGDIDDRIGSASKLQSLKESNADFASYLANIERLPISRASIPFGAGISEDGKTIYIDSRLDTVLDGVELAPALAMHEGTEWALREFCEIGVEYQTDPFGHRLANRAEYERVGELLSPSDPGKDTWLRYDEFLDPQLRKIEKGPIESPPADLAMYPYEDTPLYDKIREAQNANSSTT